MKLRSLLLAALAVALLASCGTPPDKLIIGAVNKHVAAFPLEFCIDTGLLDAEQFKIRYFSSEERLAAALAAERVDAAALPFTQFVGTDAPVRLVSCMLRNGAGVALRTEELEDTSGARVGVYGDYLVPMLAVMLSDSLRLGWNIAQYNDREALQLAWSNGEVQAVADAAPYIFGYAGESDTIVWFQQMFPGYPAGDFFVTETALATKPALIEQARKAADTASSLINAYPNQAIDRFMLAYPFRKDIIHQTLARVWYYPVDDDSARAFRDRAASMLDVSAAPLYAE